MLSFLPLSWNDRERYNALYSASPVRASEYSFFALWGWLESNPLDLAWSDNLCWLRSYGHKAGFCAPVGDWDAVEWGRVIPQHFAKGDVLLDVPDKLAARLSDTPGLELLITEARSEWEYLYKVSDLIELKGNKYAQKRAHVKAFLSNYNWEYVPLLPEDFPEVIRFHNEWCSQHKCDSIPGLASECRALLRAIEYWDDFPFAGAMLKADGKIIGYTIAEELDDETIDIRFEKALIKYSGSYQALNRLFLQRQGSSYAIVNREEDMGCPGMRDSKTSYNPSDFVKKYRVELL